MDGRTNKVSSNSKSHKKDRSVLKNQ